MCRNDRKLLKYQVMLELFGNVGPFEIPEAEIAEHSEKEQAYQEAKSQFDDKMATYMTDKEIFDNKLADYDKQQELIKAGDSDLVEEIIP